MVFTMTASGRIAVAPCGHTGETIIGTYVKCLQGCEGAAATSGRGEPGHVLNCACKPCQIRRLAQEIVLRTKDGKDMVRLPWDGVSKELRFTPNKSGHIMHYHFVDGGGKVIAQGNLDTYVSAGNEVIARPKFMMDRISMEVVQDKPKFSDMVRIVFGPGTSFAGSVGGSYAGWLIDPADLDPPVDKTTVAKDSCAPSGPLDI